MSGYMKGCPWCMVCDEQIADAKTYMLDPDDMDTCIHKDCMNAELEKMRRARVNVGILIWIAEKLEYECERITPHGGQL